MWDLQAVCGDEGNVGTSEDMCSKIVSSEKWTAKDFVKRWVKAKCKRYPSTIEQNEKWLGKKVLGQ
mgnify:FL=1